MDYLSCLSQVTMVVLWGRPTWAGIFYSVVAGVLISGSVGLLSSINTGNKRWAIISSVMLVIFSVLSTLDFRLVPFPNATTLIVVPFVNNFGIFLVTLFGFVALAFDRERNKRWTIAHSILAIVLIAVLIPVVYYIYKDLSVLESAR